MNICKNIKNNCDINIIEWKVVAKMKSILNLKYKKKKEYSRKSSQKLINCDLEDGNSIQAEEIIIQYVKAIWK